MADRVHASVHAMQPTRRDRVIDCVAGHPELEQLPPSDHSELPRRKLGDQTSQWAVFSAYIPDKTAHPGSVTGAALQRGYTADASVTTRTRY